MRRRLWFVCVSLLAFAAVSVHAAQVDLEKDEQGVAVKVNGQPFTQYITKSGAKPILWPIFGPTGQEMTRAYPMREGVVGEKTDHVHQRSFWFTHGSVNGVSFWDETDGHGDIIHKEFVKVESGDVGVLVTKNDWLGPDGKRVCSDVRTLRFGGDGETRWIDFDVTVSAEDGPVTFGDTKEGAFGVRVAATMKVDAKLGGKIVNSEGLTDAAAWGKASPWVDYHGPVAGATVGIAILNHPVSFRHPTTWHVRTYGLFAANPFGLRDFNKGDKNVDGAHTIPKGETMRLRYRVLFHKGDEKAGGVAEAYAKFAAEK